ncbi:site-specific integrase [Yinghuangia sp. ASG 101]|uniref:tyrosine-type recombinase/integrase n=1 Tax=Yinghuangia sp. ASG 101 TaxID=2896848 RepID=UPI001E52BECF|nr:site-specific integrase [Yinghuangia sp. ASG 101]UGQ14329.1 site-specific integrase [Yinghuangia sp. ASG 101]
MASIQKRPNGKWRARWYDEDRQERSRHFDRKVDAQRWLDQVTASILTGQYVDPKAGRVKLQAVAEDWQKSQVCAEGTARINDNALRLHINPALGQHAIATIRRTHVQKFVKLLSEELAPGSVRNVYDVLARVMQSAVDDRVIASTPCRRITLPKLPDTEVVPPTIQEVQAIADAMPDRYRAAVILAAGSGLRIGEILGLKVSDIDFLRRTVRVERQRTQDGEINPPKTQRSYRTVPVGQVVIDALALHLAAFPTDAWVFTDERGKPLLYRRWRTVWNAAYRAMQKAADAVADKLGQPRHTITVWTVHDLRHFFASALIAGGASVKQVQVVLGHSSAVITLRVYSHLWPGDEDRTRSVMDSVLEILRTGYGPADPAEGVPAGQTA